MPGHRAFSRSTLNWDIHKNDATNKALKYATKKLKQTVQIHSLLNWFIFNSFKAFSAEFWQIGGFRFPDLELHIHLGGATHTNCCPFDHGADHDSLRFVEKILRGVSTLSSTGTTTRTTTGTIRFETQSGLKQTAPIFPLVSLSFRFIVRSKYWRQKHVFHQRPYREPLSTPWHPLLELCGHSLQDTPCTWATDPVLKMAFKKCWEEYDLGRKPGMLNMYLFLTLEQKGVQNLCHWNNGNLQVCEMTDVHDVLQIFGCKSLVITNGKTTTLGPEEIAFLIQLLLRQRQICTCLTHCLIRTAKTSCSQALCKQHWYYLMVRYI